MRIGKPATAAREREETRARVSKGYRVDSKGLRWRFDKGIGSWLDGDVESDTSRKANRKGFDKRLSLEVISGCWRKGRNATI